MDCFTKWNRSDLQDKFQKLVDGGMNEKEAARKTILDEHENIHNSLNDLRKKNGLKTTEYKPQSNEEKINSINEKYKQNALPIRSSTSVPMAETSGNSEKVGSGVPESGQTPPTQGGNEAKAEIQGEEKTIGARHESLTNIAKRLGLGEPERGTFLSPQDQLERGRKLLKEGADPQQIAEDFAKDGKVNADIISVARAHQEDLARATDNAKGTPAYEAAEKAFDDWNKNVIKKMGTASGGAFSTLQGETNLDTGSFVSVKKAVENATEKPLTKEQEKEAEQKTEKVKKTEKEAADAESKLIAKTDEELGTTKTKKAPKEKLSVQLSDVAKRIRTSIEFDDFLKGASGDAQKMGVDLPRLKEIAASILEDAAKAVKAGEDAIDFIKDAVSKLAEDLDKNKFTEALNSIVEKSGLYKTPDQAFEERKNSGLVRSKMEKPLTAVEQLEIDDAELEKLQKKFVDKTGNKFSEDESKAIWEYAKNNYLDKGVSYRDMIKNVKNDLGLTWDQVSSAVTTPKTKPISNTMWSKQAELRQNQSATKKWVAQQNQSWEGKAFRKITGGFRAELLFGHGGVFVGTHAGSTLVDPATVKHTINAFFDGYRLAYGSEGYNEKRATELKADPNYVLSNRAGLKNNPDNFRGEEYQNYSTWLGKKIGRAGEKGFVAIKVLRQKLFNYEWNKLSDGEKTDKSAEKIAWLINNATGATNLKMPAWTNEVFLSGGMEAARWAKYTTNPLKATSTAVKAILSPKSVSPEERVFAKVWAQRVGRQLATYAGLLYVNSAIQSKVNPSNPVNITDPSKPDWLQMKFGKVSIDASSGMLGEARFLHDIATIPTESKTERKGNTEKESASKKALNRALGKLSPAYSTAAELYFKHDYNGNTLPWVNEKTDNRFAHKLTPIEYIGEKMPLPVSEAFKAAYEGAHQEGLSKPEFDNIVSGAVRGAFSGGTGFRVNEYQERSQKSNKSRP